MELMSLSQVIPSNASVFMEGNVSNVYSIISFPCKVMLNLDIVYFPLGPSTQRRETLSEEDDSLRRSDVDEKNAGDSSTGRLIYLTNTFH